MRWFTGLPAWALELPHTGGPAESDKAAVAAVRPVLEQAEKAEALCRMREEALRRQNGPLVLRSETRLAEVLRKGLGWRIGSRLAGEATDTYRALLRAGAEHPTDISFCEDCLLVFPSERKARPCCDECGRRRRGTIEKKVHHKEAWETPLTGSRRYLGSCQDCGETFRATDARTVKCRNCGSGAGRQRKRRGGSARGRQRFAYRLARPGDHPGGALSDWSYTWPDGTQLALEEESENVGVTDDAEEAQLFDFLCELGILDRLPAEAGDTI